MTLTILASAWLLCSSLAGADDPGTIDCRAGRQCAAIAAELKTLGTPPTRIIIMPARYRELLASADGLKKTGILGVEWEGGQFKTSADDLGLYLVVPWLAAKFGVSVARAYDLLCVVAIIASCIAGMVGFLYLTSSLWPRVVAVFAVLLTSLLAVSVGDVYLTLGVMPVALVPWILVASRRGSLWLTLVIGMAAGALSVVADSVRSGAGIILLIFLTIVWVFSRTTSVRVRMSGLAAAALGFVVVWAGFQVIVARRDAFLLSHSSQITLRTRHTFWHSVYIGLGYLNNSEVPAYKDEVAVARVCLVDRNSDFYSPAYEQVLKSATVQIARNRPGLIIRELAHKALVEFTYILLFANIGWIAFFTRRIVWPIDLAFLAAIAINALYGLLTVPLRTYLFGMIAYSALFGATSVILAVNEAKERQPTSSDVPTPQGVGIA
jgi:hypothetical protein